MSMTEEERAREARRAWETEGFEPYGRVISERVVARHALECHIAEALAAARAEALEDAWTAVASAMANETQASQRRVRGAINALRAKP